MKKLFLAAMAMMMVLMLAACSEDSNPETGLGSFAMEGPFPKIYNIKSSSFGDYTTTLTLIDDREKKTNNTVSIYQYTPASQENVLTFLTGGRIGTLTPEYNSDQGKVALIGWSGMEYHFIKEVSYGNPTTVTLANGLKIKTNDIVSVEEFRSKAEKEEVLKDILKRVEDAKKFNEEQKKAAEAEKKENN